MTRFICPACEHEGYADFCDDCNTECDEYCEECLCIKDECECCTECDCFPCECADFELNPEEGA